MQKQKELRLLSFLKKTLSPWIKKVTYNIFHHQGALHVVMGQNRRSLMTKRSWDIIMKVWPAVVQAQHSEKPSILRLIDDMAEKLHKNVESTELIIKVS